MINIDICVHSLCSIETLSKLYPFTHTLCRNWGIIQSTAFSLFDAYWIQIMLNNNWLVNPIDIISLDFVHMTGNFVHRKLQANMFGRFCKICTESLNLKNIRLCNNLNSTRQLIVIICNFHMQRHYINWQTNLQWSVYSEKWNFIFGAQMKYHHHHHHHVGLGLNVNVCLRLWV